MAGIYCIRAVYPAGRYNLKWGVFFFHNPYLYRRCLAAQEGLFFYVEGIEYITRGVLKRYVERLEIIIFRFYLRPFHYPKAQTDKDLVYPLYDLRNGVFVSYAVSF